MPPPVDVRRSIPLLGILALLCGVGCATEPLGDNFEQPEVQIDEDFFFCRVQPEVIALHRCASGGDGDGGCHSTRSAMRLDPLGETDPPPSCDADGVIVGGVVPQSYRNNLEAVRFAVRPDPLSSPILQRATGGASHPRVIFDISSVEADLIIEWILR